MSPLDLARRYKEIFYAGDRLDELRHLFARDFTFSGPFYSFDSGDDYVESLVADPPRDCDYEIIEAFESDSSACLVYRFTKPGLSVPMAQLFDVSKGRIHGILLIFDTAAFT